MDVVLRVDGGSQIGYGHLIRSGALADELHSRGHSITVATTTTQLITAVFPEGVTTVELPSREDPDTFVKWLDTATADVVFTDAYPVDTAYQRAVRQRAPLAVLQDDARHAVCADLFVNGNLYATDLDYEFVGETPRTCLGTEYVLLRREIREYAAEKTPFRAVPQRAIVTMGGGDTANLTPTVVQAFDGCDLHVDAVIGPGCSTELEQDVRRVAAETSTAVSVSRDPDNLIAMMEAADFAVSTASTTTYELLALGTPIVSIPVVDNQELIAAALRSRDAAIVLQRDSDEEAFQKAIEELVNNVELRRKRRIQGQQLVDGNGTTRVFSELLATVEASNQ